MVHDPRVAGLVLEHQGGVVVTDAQEEGRPVDVVLRPLGVPVPKEEGGYLEAFLELVPVVEGPVVVAVDVDPRENLRGPTPLLALLQQLRELLPNHGHLLLEVCSPWLDQFQNALGARGAGVTSVRA